MKQSNLRLALHTLVFLLVGPGWLRAAPRLSLSNDPEGDEVRTAAHDFLIKIAEGDIGGAKLLFAGPSDHEAILDAQLRYVIACNKLSKTLAARFGDDSANFGVGVGEFRKRAENRHTPLVLNGDSACLAAGYTSNPGLDLKRISGRWKVTHVTIDYRDTSRPREFFDGIARASDEVREGVVSRKLVSPRAVAAELISKTERLFAIWETRRFAAMPATYPASALPVPDAKTLTLLLGKSLQDREIQSLVASLPETPRIADFGDRLSIRSFEDGFSLSFQIPSGKLRHIYFYGPDDPEYTCYPRALPFGLAFGEPRTTVEHKLGPPDEINRLSIAYAREGLLVSFQNELMRDPSNPIVFLSISAPGSARPSDGGTPVGEGPRLTFRLVLNPGQSDPTAERVPDPVDRAGGSFLFLSRTVLFDENDVATVRGLRPALSQVLKQWGIDFTMTPTGARRLEAISIAHAGERIAILLNGRVVIATTIAGKSSDHLIVDLSTGATLDNSIDLLKRVRYVVYSLPKKKATK